MSSPQNNTARESSNWYRQQEAHIVLLGAVLRIDPAKRLAALDRALLAVQRDEQINAPQTDNPENAALVDLPATIPIYRTARNGSTASTTSTASTKSFCSTASSAAGGTISITTRNQQRATGRRACRVQAIDHWWTMLWYNGCRFHLSVARRDLFYHFERDELARLNGREREYDAMAPHVFTKLLKKEVVHKTDGEPERSPLGSTRKTAWWNTPASKY